MRTNKPPIRLTIVFVLMSFLATTCLAQNVARYDAASNSIEFRLSSTSPNEILGVSLRDSSTRTTSEIDVRRIKPAASGDYLEISLTRPETPASVSTYPVTLTFDIKKEDKITSTTVQVFAPGTAGKTELGRDVAEGRDDANVYVSGSAEFAGDQKPDFALDVNLQREFSLSDKVPFYGTPFVDFQFTNDDDASDKFRGGGKFSLGAPQKKLRYSFSGELESDHKWKVVNLISRNELKYLVTSKRFKEDRTTKAILLPNLFVGGEFGGNLRSPVRRDGSGIARLLAGASLEFKWFEPFEKASFLKKFNVKKLIWENKFEQRWFLAKEQSYDKEEGHIVVRDFGRKPRSYVASKLHFRFSENWGPTFSYEWGQLPPLYNKVDHNFKVGITYSFLVAPK